MQKRLGKSNQIYYIRLDLPRRFSVMTFKYNVSAVLRVMEWGVISAYRFVSSRNAFTASQWCVTNINWKDSVVNFILSALTSWFLYLNDFKKCFDVYISTKTFSQWLFNTSYTMYYFPSLYMINYILIGFQSINKSCNNPNLHYI